MLGTEKKRTDDCIIEVLAERPAQTAAQIYARARARLHKELTPPGWYKALGRLVDQEVLIKSRKTYSLNVRWLLSVVRLAEKAEQANIVSPPLPTVRLPRRRERVTYRFKTLIEMDAFWGHLLVYIASQSKKPVRYDCYTPHFWFYLVHEHAETEFQKGMKELGVRTRYLVGSNSFLDRFNASFFDPSFVTARLYPVPLYTDTRKTHIVIGDYFIETTIAPEAAKEIDSLFERTRSIEDVSPLTLIRIFRGRSPSAITVSRGSLKRARLKRLMDRYMPRS